MKLKDGEFRGAELISGGIRINRSVTSLYPLEISSAPFTESSSDTDAECSENRYDSDADIQPLVNSPNVNHPKRTAAATGQLKRRLYMIWFEV